MTLEYTAGTEVSEEIMKWEEGEGRGNCDPEIICELHFKSFVRVQLHSEMNKSRRNGSCWG